MRWPLLCWGLGLLSLAACSQPPSPAVNSAASRPTTQLEAPQVLPSTQIEVEAAPVNTQISTNALDQTATEVVQQALSQLNAQQTSDGIRIVLPENILFDFDQFNIRPDAKATLTSLSQIIRHYSAPVAIQGYTDSKGSDAYNQTLSDQRAKSVKDYLVQNFSIKADLMTTKGFGETQPVAPNTNPDGSDNPEGRQKNRRVEVLIQN
ncbi:MAG: OmpA family protein [Oculatellaceae cyanobacterium Prado106]|jgi:outer membrane protein OmpA-like peptidoglycan-associated protein|nr:OmpA family protein [Oculatellaceae cyanobacterium Prado106]